MAMTLKQTQSMNFRAVSGAVAAPVTLIIQSHTHDLKAATLMTSTTVLRKNYSSSKVKATT